MRATSGLAGLVLICFALACSPSAEIRHDFPNEGAPWEIANPVIPLPTPPVGIPARFSPLRVTAEKVRLGRWLFYDARLSGDETVSCATCHRPKNAFSELTPRSTGIGGRKGTRKAPSLVNVAFLPFDKYFWDGRASSLSEQAKSPIVNPVEMGSTLEGTVRRLAHIPGYRRAFREVYGDGRVEIDRVTDALAAYEATRLSGDSAYDRFEAGDDDALSPQALLGREIFFGRGRCNACHLGPAFTDARFHNIGIGYRAGESFVRTGFLDPGRYAVTHLPVDIGAFKTPTLRDVERHPPYMHDGSSRDLYDAVLRYVDLVENPWLDPAMREVNISVADVPALVAFLESLNGTGYEDVAPSRFPE